MDAHLIAGAKRIGSVRLGAAPRTVYLHRDRLGSVVATTLAGGQAGASYRYSPYGATEVALGDAGNAASELGYAGALRLSGGLLLMGARVYHPGMKTFLQTDPLSPYAYRYTEGDPVNFADPTGMEAEQQAGGGCTPQGGTCKTIPSLSDGSTMGWAITSDGGFVYWAPDDVGVSWSVTDDGVVHITFGNGDHWGSYRAFETRGGGLNGASDRVFGDRVARAPREGGDRNSFAGAYQLASGVNALAGSTAGLGESMAGGSRLGTNGALYGQAFYGNKYVKTFSVAKALKSVGLGSLAFGLLWDGAALRNGEISGQKFALNATIGILGVAAGVPGVLIASVYFGVDGLYPGGWNGALSDLGEVRY